MEDRYIMLVDEHGQPYICHAGMFQKAGNAIKSAGKAAVNAVRNAGSGRGIRQSHKYIMKVGSPEKPRYLYTQDEVRAYLQGGRRALNNAVDKAGQTAKNAVRKAGDVIKYKAGVDEREKRDQAQREYDSAKRSAKRMRDTAKRKELEANRSIDVSEIGKLRADAYELGSKADRMELKSKRDFDKAQYAYDKTLLGITEPVSKIVKDVAGNVKNKYGDKKEKDIATMKAEMNPDYKKKPRPVNESGFINYDTLKRDAKEAGVDISALDAVSKKVEKLSKKLKSDPKSPYGDSWWKDPTYHQAVVKETEELEKIISLLYVK